MNATDFLSALGERSKSAYADGREILTFDTYLELVTTHPERFARSAVQYMLDALRYFGSETVESGPAKLKRHKAFDAPFGDGRRRVVGHEFTQQELIQRLESFEREGYVNRLILLHGPNGSAKSSFVGCLMGALEAYSRTDEGAIYRFNWVFPSGKLEGTAIGFSHRTSGPRHSYALLEDTEIDVKLPGEQNDNPLFLLPAEERETFLRGALGEREFRLSETVRGGDLSPRSRKVFDALVHTHRGDLNEVYRHVQVERFYVSQRYRSAAVTVEPQLRVDAGARQLTADRSLAALPAVLQNQTLFETFGALVDGNRGLIEYNDLLKRPMDLNKYLLATAEKGSVSMDHGMIHLDAVLLATGNETFLEAFKQAPDWASYRARMELVRMPYLLNYHQEQAIYDDLLAQTETAQPMPPHTTFVLALWAVLTRLWRPDAAKYPEKIRKVIESLKPADKAMLYADGRLPAGLSADLTAAMRDVVPQIMSEHRRGDSYEGRYGASPREMKALLLSLAHRDGAPVSPMLIFKKLRQLAGETSVYEWLSLKPEGSYHRPAEFVDTVKELYLDRVEREVQAASGFIDLEQYETLMQDYLNQAKHWLRGEKVTHRVTGKKQDPDEEFMRDIEKTLGRSESEKEFRSQAINRIAAFRIDHPEREVVLREIFPLYLERLEARYYASKREALAKLHKDLLHFFDGDTSYMDDKAKAQVESTLETLKEKFGYSAEHAKLAVAILLRERYATK